MTIIERLNEGIKEAMRQKDQIRLSTLRMLKSKIMMVDARCALPDTEVLKLFKTYYGNIHEAMEQAEAVHRPEAAEQLRSELKIIQEFLPKPLSLEETKRLIEQAIKESGAKTKKDLGLVMKAVMKINNTVDGKLAKDLASQLLSD